MKLYSKTIVRTLPWFFRKIRGAIGLYRLRALINDVGGASRCPLNVELKCPENISMGNHVSVGPYSTIGAFEKVTIEDYVRIS